MPCPHRSSIRKIFVEELKQMAKGNCKDCEKKGPNLWACLQECCDYVGCGRCGNNHIEAHHKENDHQLCVCLRDFRVWCFSCETEVDPNKSCSSASSQSTPEESPGASEKTNIISDEQDFLESERGLKPRGLCGLMNIGNTCYMNSALQALSNCPPLTQHFLECGKCLTDAKHPGVSGNYSQLVNEMWSRKRSKYLVPSHLLRSVRSVNSQFRGYGQQDSQEFLRCIMDQMHEELKEPVVSLLPECDSSDETEEHNHCAKRLLGGTNLPSGSPKEDSDTEMLSDTETVDSNSPLHVSTGEQQADDSINAVDPDDIQIDTVSDEEEPMDMSTSEEQKVLLSDAAIEESPPEHDAVNPTELKREAVTETGDNVESEANQLKRSSLKSVQSECERREDPPKKKEVVYRSIVTDLFDGKIQSSVQCLTCNRVSSRLETFQDLSLPIPGKDELSMIHASQCSPLVTCSALNDNSEDRGWVTSVWDWLKRWIYGPQVTLQDCLAAFFSADELKGDNMYSCEKCKKLRNGIKLCKVSQLPELLCIHLKRFRHEMYFSSKINHLVTFPLTGLDMRPFLVKDSKSDQCCTTYDLVSVITHHGSVGAGHYVAFAKNYIDGKWYEFNDSWVSEVSDSYVDSVEAYVLFYRKVSEEAQKERQLFANMTRNAQPHNTAKCFVSKSWLTKFQTCAEPGPVTNTEFICCHGAIQPLKADRIKDLVVCVPQTVWRHFQLRYGGGPTVSQLEVCEQCKRALEELEKRRKLELETFKKLNSQYPASSKVDEYHISMRWFRRWELFVKGEEEDPPGPIDNNDILVTKGHVKVLRAGANPGQLSQEAWTFLHDIYGGGPVYVQEAEPEPEPEEQDS